MPQTQGLERPDAQTDSDGEIRDDTFSAAGSDDDLLDELDKDLEEKEKTGEAVADSLANIVNKSFRRKLSEDKLKERFDKYLRRRTVQPSRCLWLTKRYGKPCPRTHGRPPYKASHVQKAVAKAGVALWARMHGSKVGALPVPPR